MSSIFVAKYIGYLVIFEGDDDDYETHVVGRHIRNRYNVRYITQDIEFDEKYYHCHSQHIRS